MTNTEDKVRAALYGFPDEYAILTVRDKSPGYQPDHDMVHTVTVGDVRALVAEIVRLRDPRQGLYYDGWMRVIATLDEVEPGWQDGYLFESVDNTRVTAAIVSLANRARGF
jgi:hypothetical protein